MTTFKKYTAGVFCIETADPLLNYGDKINVTTKHGKEVECTIWKKLFSRDGVTYYSYVRDDGFNRTAWMQRKADRAQAAAARQEGLSNAYYEKSNKDRDFLVLGEPIKVGHHSEKRHRKIIEQANSNMGKCVEASRKAEAYADKAETLQYQADHQINIDTPDCLEALQAKVERLEAQREVLKASGSYSTYQLSNAAANIKRCRDRLEVARKLWDLAYIPTPKVKKQSEQERVNAILDKHGVIWAFSNEQFEKNKKEGTVYVSIGSGGYCPKENVDAFIQDMKA